MYLTLRVSDSDEHLQVPIRGELGDALLVQMQRCSLGERRAWLTRVGLELERTIIAALDSDLRPPTGPQIAYALAIAKALKVNLPGEALQNRGAMGDFLDRYGAQFKQRGGSCGS